MRATRNWSAAFAFLLALFVWCVPAFAADGKADPEGFEPVKEEDLQSGESIPASRLVAGAYGFMFAAVVVYAATLASRTRKVEEELEQLRAQIKK